MTRAIASVLLLIACAGRPGASQIQPREVIRSPALAALQEDVAKGRQDLDRFWRRARANGLPMVEALPGSPGRSLVTFLYRSALEATIRVEPHLGATLSNGVGRDFHALGNLERLDGTDVYYRTFEVSNALRHAYRFRVNGRQGLDPLNPRVFAADTAFAASIVSLPEAPSQPWSGGATTGRWVQHRLPSAALGGDQTIWVYVPASYGQQPRVPHAVLIGLDSVAFRVVLPTAQVIDHLIATRAIAPTLIVAVPDLGGIGDNAGYDPAVKFLADELVPWVRRAYSVSAVPDDVAIAGTSRRGLVASYAALRRSDVFGGVLSLSGAFYWRPPGTTAYAWLPALVAREPKKPLRWFLAVGALESVVTPTNAGHYPLATSRHMHDVLLARGYSVRYAEFYGVHNDANWQDMLAPGLTYLLGGTTGR